MPPAPVTTRIPHGQRLCRQYFSRTSRPSVLIYQSPFNLDLEIPTTSNRVLLLFTTKMTETPIKKKRADYFSVSEQQTRHGLQPFHGAGFCWLHMSVNGHWMSDHRAWLKGAFNLQPLCHDTHGIVQVVRCFCAGRDPCVGWVQDCAIFLRIPQIVRLLPVKPVTPSNVLLCRPSSLFRRPLTYILCSWTRKWPCPLRHLHMFPFLQQQHFRRINHCRKSSPLNVQCLS